MSLKKSLHSFFIPSEHNNYRSKALHLSSLTYYVVAAILLSSFIKLLPQNHVLGVATDITIPKLYELTNDERIQHGLSPLSYNQQLATAAENKARDMFENNYWAHFNGTTTPWQFIIATGYNYSLAGENLAKDFMLSQDVVNAWMNSPTHRDNMLKSGYTDIGFAVINGNLKGEDTTLVVQMFGKQLSTQTDVVKGAAVSSTVSTTPVAPPQKTGVIRAQPQERTPLFHGNSVQTIIIVFFIFLLGVLVLDLYHTHHLHLNRLTGKSLAHFIFLAVIILSLLFLIGGSIL